MPSMSTATIMTTNHGSDGLYLGRTIAGITSPALKSRSSDHAEVSGRDLGWYATGGLDHVVAWFHAHDVAAFDAKAPPFKTPEFWRLVDAGVSSAVPELRDAIEAAGDGQAPAAVTLDLRAADFRQQL